MHLPRAKVANILGPAHALFFSYHMFTVQIDSVCKHVLWNSHAGQYVVQKVVPQASGESSKVKVKVRVNIHGIFSVSSASLVELQKSEEEEESMDTEQSTEKENEVLLQDTVHMASIPQINSALLMCILCRV